MKHLLRTIDATEDMLSDAENITTKLIHKKETAIEYISQTYKSHTKKFNSHVKNIAIAEILCM